MKKVDNLKAKAKGNKDLSVKLVDCMFTKDVSELMTAIEEIEDGRLWYKGRQLKVPIRKHQCSAHYQLKSALFLVSACTLRVSNFLPSIVNTKGSC